MFQNAQDKKRTLLGYRMLDMDIKRVLDEVARIRSQAEKMTASFGDLGTATGSDIQKAVEKLEHLEKRLCNDASEMIRQRLQIENSICLVPDKRLQLLLRYRYIDGLTLERIAVTMNYSYMQVCRLHGKALEAIML